MATAKKIPTRKLGANGTGPSVSAVGLGTMGMLFNTESNLIFLILIIVGIGAFYGKTDDEAAYKALTYSADRGMTFWDCADIYGTSESHISHNYHSAIF